MHQHAKARVDNTIYAALGERWYTAQDDPIALLRAENRARTPWMLQLMRHHPEEGALRILDVGCGAGFLSNALAAHGLEVTGIDASEEALAVARTRDRTGRVDYRAGDAGNLPFGSVSFDAVCAMDLLEHVENPDRVIREASRVLRPGGLFFFHTFNRNPLSWLIVIKGVECFVRNTPPNLHVLGLFLRPAEIRELCRSAGLAPIELRGLRPEILNRAFWKMILSGRVGPEFRFRFSRSLLTGYCGAAVRSSIPIP